MANSSIERGELPFNIPTGIAEVEARDAEFWRLHSIWRLAEDDFSTVLRAGADDDAEQQLLGHVDEKLFAMMRIPVRTGMALSAKLEAVREMGTDALNRDLKPGISIFDCIRWDCERIAKAEMFGPDAFADTAEG